ncbi:MAG: helix-turn-helix transcriptional regulator [Pseudomonadota bacterium]
MTTTPQIRLRSFDLENLAQAVGRVYCPHKTQFKRTRGAVPGVFGIRQPGLQPVVDLRYGARAKVDAGEFPRLMLMRTCIEGGGVATQQGVTVALRPGETLPMSADLRTHVELDAHFAQRSVKLDIDRVEEHCARILNRPLDRGLRFELRPFSPSLEKAWTEAVGLVVRYANMNLVLPAASAASLDEFMISLVLNQHRHNYTDEFDARPRVLPPRLIREAEQLMRTASSQLTVSRIAAHLGVSLRSLEAGFREHRRTTPLRHLRSIRLDKVREMLLSPRPSTTVTSAALECGFVHLSRFSGYYRGAFGESPAQTLRRHRDSGAR